MHVACMELASTLSGLDNEGNRFMTAEAILLASQTGGIIHAAQPLDAQLTSLYKQCWQVHS